ncbi:MAG: signal peptidase II [Mariprofundaceae bacterium]|nr:signal peptidase II [Mariprofundaceae bacterium]
MWDRVQLGYVVDFIEWYMVIDGKAWYWPTFNIADSCISVAVVLLLVDSFRSKKEREVKK